MVFVTTLFAVALATLNANQPTTDELKSLGAKVVERQGEIVEVTVDVKDFGINEFKKLGACSTLRKLSMDGKTVNDESLPLLAGLTALEELSINASQLTDEGYRHFAPFQSLRKLSLWHPSWDNKQFTGAGLVHLKSLKSLESLTFAGSTAGDEALAAIGTLTQLKSFQTWHTRQSNAGNRYLAGLSQLKSLKMGQRLPKWGDKSPPSFDGSTIPVIAQLPALEQFEIFEAVLTAKDLEPLKSCPTLQKLKIHTTEIAAADIETLKQWLPKVTIDYMPISDSEREATLIKKLKLLE